MNFKKTLMATIPAALIFASTSFFTPSTSEAADRYVCDDYNGAQVYIIESSINAGYANHRNAKFKFVKNGRLQYTVLWDFNRAMGVWRYDTSRDQHGMIEHNPLAGTLLSAIHY